MPNTVIINTTVKMPTGISAAIIITYNKEREVVGYSVAKGISTESGSIAVSDIKCAIISRLQSPYPFSLLPEADIDDILEALK